MNPFDEMNRFNRMTDTLLYGIIKGGIAISIATLGFAVIDGVQSFRAEPAVIACKQRRMEAERLSLRSTVYCVPAYRGTRNDTITVEGMR